MSNTVFTTILLFPKIQYHIRLVKELTDLHEIIEIYQLFFVEIYVECLIELKIFLSRIDSENRFLNL
jgi:hypothetical protein